MNKILLSFSAFSCFIVTCTFFAFLSSRCSSVLGHSTLWKHCKWSFVLLHKKPHLQYLQFMLFGIFNWRKFIQISFEFKHKLEFLMNSSVQIPLIKLEFLRNSSIIFKSSYQRCFIQKTVLKSLWYSQKNNCGGVSFLIKLQTFEPVTLLKMDSNTGAFLWVKFLRTPILKKMIASEFLKIVF